ncbi:MAG: sulfate ABC transporter substrate-binding protein [Deltaproteobacteria bacterium]|nr:sulfate ABC transporter substrate-binding protein [Deltaproteobacteria bacterium]
MRPHTLVTAASVSVLLGLIPGCSGEADPDGPVTRKLVIGAYTTPREAMNDHLLPKFKEAWQAKTGEIVEFETSFQASGSQARAISGGFEADVAWLSLEPDVQTLVDAGLITRDWRATPTKGIVSSSVVVIGVRPGNPKGVTDWADLGKPGVEVLTPNVRTSGGAMWNVLGVVGAARRGHVGADTSEAHAEAVLASVLKNVRVMDKGARDSMISFEKGIGDAIISYENELVVAALAGQKLDTVIPKSTVIIENPAAVVDVYAERHGVTDLADAFVAFLTEPAQQEALAKYGLRPVVDGVPVAGFPALGDTFTAADLGGWASLKTTVFADGALYDRALTRAQSAQGQAQ